MNETALLDLFEAGAALIVATVDDTGLPRASRAWGLERCGPRQVRLLLDADDPLTVAHAAAGCRMAVTAADVPTLRSAQIKGTCRALTPATAEDRVRARRYCDEFFGDITRTDGTPRELLERIVPADLVACLVDVDALFDQTPGPGAGAGLAPAPR